jgi:hypothetical protein
MSQAHVVLNDAISLARETFRVWAAGQADEKQLRRALRTFCDAAHVQRLRAEEVLIALKRICRSVPAVTVGQTRTDNEKLIARAVTVCIEEYYAIPVDSRRPRGSDLTAR